MMGGVSMKLVIKNENLLTVEFCCGEKEYLLEPSEELVIEVNDGDCMYFDAIY